MPDPFIVDASEPMPEIDPEHARVDADATRWVRDLMSVIQETSADDLHPAFRAAFRDAAGPLADLERGLREHAEG